MNSARSLISRLVASLATIPDFIPLLHSWDTEPDEKPFVIVSAEFAGSDHPRLKTLELRVEIVSHRFDTSAALVDEYEGKILEHIETKARTIAETMLEDGWQTRAWSDQTPFATPGENRTWESGFEYRVVLMEI